MGTETMEQEQLRILAEAAERKSDREKLIQICGEEVANRIADMLVGCAVGSELHVMMCIAIASFKRGLTVRQVEWLVSRVKALDWGVVQMENASLGLAQEKQEEVVAAVAQKEISPLEMQHQMLA